MAEKIETLCRVRSVQLKVSICCVESISDICGCCASYFFPLNLDMFMRPQCAWMGNVERCTGAACLSCTAHNIQSNPIQANQTRLPKIKVCVHQCLQLQCAFEAVANLFATSFLQVQDSCRRKLHRNLSLWWLNRLHGVSKSSKCRVAKS